MQARVFHLAAFTWGNFEREFKMCLRQTVQEEDSGKTPDMNNGSLLVFSTELMTYILLVTYPPHLPIPLFIEGGKQFSKNVLHVHLNSIKYSLKEVFGMWYFASQIIKSVLRFHFSQTVIKNRVHKLQTGASGHSASFPLSPADYKMGTGLLTFCLCSLFSQKMRVLFHLYTILLLSSNLTSTRQYLEQPS